MIAWLDADTDEQARMRDIIRLFTDRDSRDELGIGQIRDAISDGLFPGTSVLLTRARYLLFVPWCFQLAQGKPHPTDAATKLERELISSLRRSGHEDLTGLLGARAGESLQTLPSTIYWATLRRYGIVRSEFAWKSDVFSVTSHSDDGDDEASRTGASAWSRSLPHVPGGFPSELPDAFELSRAEAGWLRDRILEHAPGTAIAQLMERAPLKESRSPWVDPALQGMGGEAAGLLRNAEAFSTAIHGASLLYNLLLAEEYERLIPDEQRKVMEPVERYRDALREWSGRVEAARIEQWDVDDLWSWVFGAGGARIAPGSVRFVTTWVEHVRATEGRDLADDTVARDLIRARERAQKRGLARLGNAKRLAAWSGAAGANALTYRWDTVRGIALDIHDGLGRDA